MKNECDRQDVQRQKKWGNCQKQFVFVVGNCACFQSFGIHNSMNA